MDFVKHLMVFFLGLDIVQCLNNEIQMIVDVTRSYDRPTAVFAKVCWRLFDKKSLAKELMNTKGAKTVQFVENLSLIEKFRGDEMIILLDLNCHKSQKVLEEISKSNKFGKPYRWMLLSSADDWKNISTNFTKLSIFIDSDVTIAYNTKNNETYLQKVYKIDLKSDLVTEEFGTWTLEDGLNIAKEAKNTALMRRKNFRGKRIGISLVSIDNSKIGDILILKDFVKDNIAKSTFHNALPLYSFINASTEIIFTDTWGYYINNTWNGMIGQITRGDADLCGTVTFMSQKRSTVLSFLTQPIPIEAKFIFREPPLSLQNNLFYLPFRTTVWMCIGALAVMLMVVIYINAKWEVEKNGKCDDPTILKPIISDVAILVAGAVVQQSGISSLKGSRGRMIIFIMFLICLFLYTAYSANIVALLQSSSDQIRTLSDLLNSKFELGVEDQPYTRHYFTTSTDRVRKAIYDNKIASSGYKPNFMSIEEGVKRLRNIDVPFAFHMNTGLGYKLVEQNFLEHEKCGLREIRYIQTGVPWMCCNKQSPYQELYKIGLARILEHGLSDRVNRLIYTRKPFCNSHGGSFGSVNMTDFHPVLLYLLYGMIASVMLLAGEILVYKRQRRKFENINEGNDIPNEDGYSC